MIYNAAPPKNLFWIVPDLCLIIYFYRYFFNLLFEGYIQKGIALGYSIDS